MKISIFPSQVADNQLLVISTKDFFIFLNISYLTILITSGYFTITTSQEKTE
jgi:hypothetical protein